jgi:hypothetical protein
MDRIIRRIINFTKSASTNEEHIPVLTNYLKNHKKFKDTAQTLHSKKENVKSSFWNSIDDMLKEEDQVKFIEDKSNKNGNKRM